MRKLPTYNFGNLAKLLLLLFAYTSCDSQPKRFATSMTNGKQNSPKSIIAFQCPQYKMVAARSWIEGNWQGSASIDIESNGQMVSRLNIFNPEHNATIQLPRTNSFIYNAENTRQLQYMAQQTGMPLLQDMMGRPFLTAAQNLSYYAQSMAQQGYLFERQVDIPNPKGNSRAPLCLGYFSHPSSPNMKYAIVMSTSIIGEMAGTVAWMEVPHYVLAPTQSIELVVKQLVNAIGTFEQNPTFLSLYQKQQQANTQAALQSNATRLRQGSSSGYIPGSNSSGDWTTGGRGLSTYGSESQNQSRADAIIGWDRRVDASGNEHLLNSGYNNAYIHQNSNTIIQTNESIDSYGWEELQPK